MLPLTIKIQVGRKLSDKRRDEILDAVLSYFAPETVRAVQVGYDVVRVTFREAENYRSAKEREGVRLFGMWCRVLGGGPPTTLIHIFDYPFEEPEADIRAAFEPYGAIKSVKRQTYLSHPSISTGTVLVSIVMKEPPPRYLMVRGYYVRTWYRGQPLVCNMCSAEGHRAADCPNRDKCRRCGGTGHFARACLVSRPSFAEVARGVAGSSSLGTSGPVVLPIITGALRGADDDGDNDDVNDDDFISSGEDACSKMSSASGGQADFSQQVTVDSAISKVASVCSLGNDSVEDKNEPSVRSRAASLPCLSEPSVSEAPVFSVESRPRSLSSADEPPVASKSDGGLTGLPISVSDPMSGECENNASVTSDVACSHPSPVVSMNDGQIVSPLPEAEALSADSLELVVSGASKEAPIAPAAVPCEEAPPSQDSHSVLQEYQSSSLQKKTKSGLFASLRRKASPLEAKSRRQYVPNIPPEWPSRPKTAKQS